MKQALQLLCINFSVEFVKLKFFAENLANATILQLIKRKMLGIIYIY